MQKSKLQFKIKNFYFLILVFSFFILSFNEVSAARLYFTPQEQVIGTEGEFSVAVDIDADKPVNTFSAGILISGPLIPFDINEANSIVNFWIDKPHFDGDSRLLTFSGITPGGFQGENGRLLVIKFKTEKEGLAVLSFDQETTKVFLHTADGVEDSLVLEKIELPIVKGKENLPLLIPDLEPPESFKPEIAKDPNLFEGKWFLVFATQDKGSGIAGYAVHETTRKKDITRIDAKKWAEAESPYLLKDQKLKSYVYVKAIDKAGNERIETIPPKYPLKWYENYLLWIIITLGAMIALIWRKKMFLNF